MSDLAATAPDGDALSVWEYRDLFLRDGIKYEKFFCPFCDVRLSGVLVYEVGELSRSPHFSAKFTHHQFGCDGYQKSVTVDLSRQIKGHYQKNIMSYPEIFVSRPEPRIAITARKIPAPEITQHEVDRRRTNHGTAGVAKPRTCLLQSLSEARNIVIKEAFNRYKNNKKERDEWLKEALSEMLLMLDDKTNYYDGFRTPKFIHRTNRRVYHGGGFVLENHGLLVIESQIKAIYEGLDVGFLVKVNKNLVGQKSPRSHQVLMKNLSDMSRSKVTVKWFAYGSPILERDEQNYCMFIDNMDFLYIK